MRKKLSRSSFDALRTQLQVLSEAEMRAIIAGGYFDDYGILYQSADGNTYWTRTKEDNGGSHGATFGDFWDSLNSDYQSAGSDMYDPNESNPYGTINNPISKEDYNTLAREGRWFGGYVEDLGMVNVYASSVDYGNSIYNGSWIRYGSSEYPVSKTDFYQLRLEGKWHGGYVEGHGYMGAESVIPGMSAPVSTGVNPVTANGVNIVVSRTGYADDTTLSKFKMFAYGPNGEILSTMEGYFLEPVADYERSTTKNSDTAILPGVYQVKPSTFHGEEGYYEVMDVVGRTQIKIHKGNEAIDTTGCLLPGMSGSINIKTGEYEVYRSGDKLEEMREFLNKYASNDNITIDITI